VWEGDRGRSEPEGWWRALTDPLEGERALPEHGEGGVHQLALELPEGPVAGEGDVLAPPRQQVCGHLWDRQPQGHPTAGQPYGGRVSVRGDAGGVDDRLVSS